MCSTVHGVHRNGHTKRTSTITYFTRNRNSKPQFVVLWMLIRKNAPENNNALRVPYYTTSHVCWLLSHCRLCACLWRLDVVVVGVWQRHNFNVRTSITMPSINDLIFIIRNYVLPLNRIYFTYSTSLYNTDIHILCESLIYTNMMQRRSTKNASKRVKWCYVSYY